MREMISSEANQKAMNLEPKVELSTVFLRLEYHIMSALFKYNNMPVFDIHVTLYPTWSLSTKQLTST